MIVFVRQGVCILLGTTIAENILFISVLVT